MVFSLFFFSNVTTTLSIPMSFGRLPRYKIITESVSTRVHIKECKKCFTEFENPRQSRQSLPYPKPPSVATFQPSDTRLIPPS